MGQKKKLNFVVQCN